MCIVLGLNGRNVFYVEKIQRMHRLSLATSHMMTSWYPSMALHGTGLRPAVLVVSPATILPTPSLLMGGSRGGERENVDAVQLLLSNSQNTSVLSVLV